MSYGQIAPIIVLSGIGLLILLGSVCAMIYVVRETIEYIRGGGNEQQRSKKNT